MNKKRNPRRALVLSIFSLLLCASLLIGSTFAWFTDTATTAITSIQAGTLDIVLEQMNKAGEWVSAEGQTLKFLDEDDTLWEPGATYRLPQLKLTNKGNLKLKYDLEITGITGDTKLNEVITWTITANGKTYDPKNTIHPMQPGESFLIDISGTMDKEASNEYQGLTIDGVGLTVYATQLGGELEGVKGEYDSDGFIYDENAEWPVRVIPTLNDEAMTATKDTDGNVNGFTYENSDKTVTATTNAAATSENAKPGMKLAKTETTNTGANFTVASTQATLAYDIEITNLATVSATDDTLANGATATITFKTNPGLEDVKMFHDGEPMTAVASATEVDAADEFFYAADGVITMCVDHFSNFTIVYNKPVAFNQADELFTTVAAAIADSNSTKVTLSADVAEAVVVNKTLTLDLAGHKLTRAGEQGAAILAESGANLTITGNGEVYGGAGGDFNAVRSNAGATVTIENGTFSVGADANGLGNSTIYAFGGQINILDGTYSSEAAYNGLYYVLNQNNNTPGVITVTGGSFANMDPAVGDDNLGGSFCGKNYETVNSGSYYNVVLKEFIDNGDGTYTITGAKGMRELATLVDNGNDFDGATITLANDIDMRNESFNPIGDSGHVFSGTFDGNEKTIYNLKIDLESNTDAHNSAGLFAWVHGTIKDLTVNGANIHGHHYTAVVAGYTYGTIDNCHVIDATVVNQHLDNEACGDKAGLIAGYQGPAADASNSIIKNCTGKNSTVAGGRDAGQLIGAGYNGQVENCSVTNVNVSAETTVACTGANIRNEIIGRVLG